MLSPRSRRILNSRILDSIDALYHIRQVEKILSLAMDATDDNDSEFSQYLISLSRDIIRDRVQQITDALEPALNEDE